MTRWTLVVSDETDRNLRAYLGQKGAKKGDLSKFIEQAVQQRLFTETAEAIKSRNADLDQNEIEAAIDEAIGALRADRP